MTTPSPPSANPLNTQTVSSPSRIRPAENTDTGESQLVQSPEDPDPGNSESREPNRDKDPPPSVILERSHVILSEAEGPPAPKPPPGNQPRIPTPARPQTTRRPMARANAETPATSEYRSATCCHCQPAPCDRATTRDRAPRSRSGTHTLPPSCRRRPVPRGAAGPRPNPHRAKPAGKPTHFHRRAGLRRKDGGSGRG